MGWLHDGGVSFQFATIKLFFTLLLNKDDDTISIFDVLDLDCIKISLKAKLF
jgi:hypothetical protein